MSMGKAPALSSPEFQQPVASTYLDFIKNRRNTKNSGSTGQEILFLTSDEKMIRINDIVWQIAETNVPVLISGEHGSGKSVVAASIHKAHSDKSRPFISFNCTQIPKENWEIELFGAERGRGAQDERYIGRIEQAENGILIIDEITCLDLDMQAKILRLLQEREFERVGGKEAIKSNARIIATTSEDVLALVSKGEFRQDLYYRLYVIHLEIPPLRDRPKDIETLSNHFINLCRDSYCRPHLQLSEEAKQKLREHKWPGNVRELQNVVQRAVLAAPQDLVDAEFIPIESKETVTTLDWIRSLPLGQPLHVVETHFILETLKSHQGNRTHAAKTLGISLRTLRNKINEFTAGGYEVMPPLTGRAS